MGATPPFWIVVLVQIVSVVGDIFGQRAARKDFKGSTRRMLFALTTVSCLQVFMLLGILEATLPVSITGAIYSSSSSTAATCYEEVDMDGHSPDYCDPTKESVRNCTVIECPAQGPFSIARSFRLHPLLWTNGLINIAYYVGEVLLYGEPLGVVLIVMAALASSFVIQPLESAMGMVDASTPIGIVFLGLIGSIACVVERKSTASEQLQSFGTLYSRFWNSIKRIFCSCCCVIAPDPDDTIAAAADDGTGAASHAGGISDSSRLIPAASATTHSSHAIDDKLVRLVPQSPDHKDIQTSADLDPDSAGDAGAGGGGGVGVVVAIPVNHTPNSVVTKTGADPATSTGDIWSVIRTTLKVGLPFLILAVTYSMWFVTQKLFNNEFRTNAFGYTSLDQTLAPVYMLAYWIIVEIVPPLRRTFVPGSDQNESLLQSIRGAINDASANRGRGLATLFFYRLLTNSRAVAYFYLSVMFDLNVVYLELTLIRIVLSWLAALVVCGFFPDFIDMTREERYTVFAPGNITLKCVGTAIIVVALVLLN